MNCSCCHSDLRFRADGSKEVAVSTGELIEMEGLFTVCESCIKEAAALCGMISEERAKALAVKNRELGQANHTLRKQLALLDDLKAVLRDAG